MQQACAEGLIHHFDGVPPDCFEGFVTLRRKVIPGFRFVKCLRLLQAVPLGDGYTLGSRPLQCNNLSTASAQIATTRRLLRSLDKRDERGVGRSIEGFELADCVSFRFGLSVQPLDGRCPERRAYCGNDLIARICCSNSLTCSKASGFPCRQPLSKNIGAAVWG